jgi:hypothetical protein
MVEMWSDGFDDGRADGANDESSVGGMVEMWSEGFDNGKADGAGDGLEVPFKNTETVGAKV